MRHQSEAAIQFSGYPLSIAELQQKKLQPSHLSVIRTEANDQTTSIQKNKITNDPKNWDVNWFNCYE